MTGQATDLFVIGTFGDREPFPLTYAEMERDRAAATRTLRELNVRHGDHVLVVSDFSETAQFAPVAAAVRDLGGVAVLADAGATDGLRIVRLLSALPCVVVFGVGAAALEGIRGAGGDPRRLLRPPRICVARPQATAQLHGSGLSVRTWLSLGPTWASTCRHGKAHWAGDEWRIELIDDLAEVRPARTRAVGAGPFRTDVRAVTVGTDCPCGRGDPFLTLPPEPGVAPE